MKLIGFLIKAIYFSSKLIIIYTLLNSSLYAQNNRIINSIFNYSISKNQIFEEKFILINGMNSEANV